MEHNTTTRTEAERLLGIADKLLRSKDFGGCRDFAILAQETDPLVDGPDQILPVAEVLLAADTKRLSNNQPDWYSILQIPNRTNDLDLIKKQYRRLALLLHPDKNKFPFSDSAFRLVADSWAVLSDPAKKSLYDTEFSAHFAKVGLKQQPHHLKRARPANANSGQKLPVRRTSRGGGDDGYEVRSANNKTGGASRNSAPTGNIWTSCPYCYNLYEYPRQYEGCCLRCDNEKCKRAFTATEILSMPPTVPGKDAYYCCWGFFPMGFSDNMDGFPQWMPHIFGDDEDLSPPAKTPVRAARPVTAAGGKKRGRPRKNL